MVWAAAVLYYAKLETRIRAVCLVAKERNGISPTHATDAAHGVTLLLLLGARLPSLTAPASI